MYLKILKKAKKMPRRTLYWLEQSDAANALI
jgi:hypothetical protein